MASEYESINPIFIFTPEQTKNNTYGSDKFITFMAISIDELQDEYTQINGNLRLFYGDTLDVIKSIHKKYTINSIGYNIDYSPYALKRDKSINKWAKSHDILIHAHEDALLVPLLTNATMSGSGTPYKVFTPFKRTVSSIQIDKPTRRPQDIKSQSLTTKHNTTTSQFKTLNTLEFPAGRDAAKKQLSKLTKYQTKYHECRDQMSYKTSNLSMYINLGLISIREVYNKALSLPKKARDSYISELYWRDFYYNIIYFYPKVIGNSFKDKVIPWRNSTREFNAWKDGMTGYPIIDASMRQMNVSGHMHNRGRMLVSSFLTKLLLIDWRKGEKYFAQQLIDYSISANNGGWQWSAGTGTDAQPFYRIFNPWTQSQKYDKDCEYIKKWVPELKNVEPKHIHKWYEFHSEYDCNYPAPIVDYTMARKRYLKSLS
jgi:deoxyribodipyrimidine photo-lyase